MLLLFDFYTLRRWQLIKSEPRATYLLPMPHDGVKINVLVISMKNLTSNNNESPRLLQKVSDFFVWYNLSLSQPVLALLEPIFTFHYNNQLLPTSTFSFLLEYLLDSTNNQNHCKQSIKRIFSTLCNRSHLVTVTVV